MGHRVLTAVGGIWTVAATGASTGFLAREALAPPGWAVALAWLGGAVAGVAAARRAPGG